MYNRIRDTVESTGKHFWIDEVGNQNEDYRNTKDYVNYLSQAVSAGINSSAQTMFLWLLFDQQYIGPLASENNPTDSFYNGIHKFGLIRHDNSTRPSYYGFSLLSKYIPGRSMDGTISSRSFETTSEGIIKISAVRSDSGDLSILVINTTYEGQSVKINLLNGSSQKTIYRYLHNHGVDYSYLNDNLIPFDKSFEGDITQFQDIIPAKSVAIYSTINDQINVSIKSSLTSRKFCLEVDQIKGGKSPYKYEWYRLFPNGRSEMFATGPFTCVPKNDYYSYRLKITDEWGNSNFSNIFDNGGPFYKTGTENYTYELFECYPNPFNPSTTIKYSIASDDHVTLKVYDMLGSEVATLVNNLKIAGHHEVTFNASNLSSGIYFYKLTAGSFSQINKMLFVK